MKNWFPGIHWFRYIITETLNIIQIETSPNIFPNKIGTWTILYKFTFYEHCTFPCLSLILLVRKSHFRYDSPTNWKVISIFHVKGFSLETAFYFVQFCQRRFYSIAHSLPSLSLSTFKPCWHYWNSPAAGSSTLRCKWLPPKSRIDFSLPSQTFCHHTDSASRKGPNCNLASEKYSLLRRQKLWTAATALNIICSR